MQSLPQSLPQDIRISQCRRPYPPGNEQAPAGKKWPKQDMPVNQDGQCHPEDDGNSEAGHLGE